MRTQVMQWYHAIGVLAVFTELANITGWILGSATCGAAAVWMPIGMAAGVFLALTIRS